MHKDALGQDGREFLQRQGRCKGHQIHIAATIRTGLKERFMMEVGVELFCRNLRCLLNMALDLLHWLQKPGPHAQMEGRRHLNPDAERCLQARRLPPVAHAPPARPPLAHGP